MLQTHMSWHCTTRHEMYSCKSMFAQLGSDIFSCTYPQIQVELLICIVKFKNTVTSNHVVACRHCVTVLPLCGVTRVLKPEARISTHFHLLFQLICYISNVSWPMGIITFQCYYIIVFLVHMLATDLLRKLPISLQTHGGCGGVKNKTHWLCFP